MDKANTQAVDASLMRVGTAYAWFVVGALSFTNMVSYLERMIVTLMFGPIKTAFHVTDTELSLLTGLAFYLFAVTSGLFFGWLADRRSRKWIITIGIVAWSFATMSCGLARNFIQLVIARMSVGIGEATLNSSAMSMIADYFPRERLARAFSFYSSSVGIGAGLALVAGGTIIALVDTLPPITLPWFGAMHSWQMTFVLVGLFGSVVIIPMLFVKEPARRGLLMASPGAQKRGVPFSVVISFLKRHWQFYLCHVMAFALGTANVMGTLTWTPSFFIRVHHWTPMQIGSAYGLSLAVVGTVGVLLGGQASEWMDRRGYLDTNMRLPALVLALTTLPSAAIYLVPSGEWAIGLIIFCHLIGSFATAPMVAALQLVTPNEMRGQIMALFAFVASLVGQGLGPLFVAVFTDYVYHSDNAVGLSLVTTILILNPIVLSFLLWSLRPYREGLKEAADRAGNILPASN